MSDSINIEKIEAYIRRYPDTTAPRVLGYFMINPEKEPEIKMIIDSVTTQLESDSEE